MPEFIQHCSDRFPLHQFLPADFLEWDIPQQFDVVLAAGVLVTRISNFESYLERFIRKMILASKGWIAFNVVASCGPSYTAKHLATISEQKLEILLKTFPDVKWEVEKKEVFPGSEDIFVCGRK